MRHTLKKKDGKDQTLKSKSSSSGSIPITRDVALELHKEYEELKAKVTWYEYGEKMLEESLQNVNTYDVGGVCHCQGCFLSKRFDASEGLDAFPKSFIFCNNSITKEKKVEEECLVKKCLILHAKYLGFEVVNRDMSHWATVAANSSSSSWKCKTITMQSLDNPIPDTCHLVVWNNNNDVKDNSSNFWSLEYGPQLSSLLLHKNPMFEKLKELFKVLEDGNAFFTDPETQRSYLSPAML